MLYTASVDERVITLDKTEFHQDAVGVDFVDLSLDSEWDGAEFTVIVFYRGRTSRGTSEICGKRLWYGEPVDVPPEALTEAGDLRLTVLGVWPDGDRIVTCEMEDGGEVCWSGAHDVDWTVEPGEDAIDALVRMVKASAVAAEEAAQSAESAEAIAKAGYLPMEGNVGQMLYKTADASEWREKPAYTAAEVGADPAGSAAAAVEQADENAATMLAEHALSTGAHVDIRAAVDALSKRLDLVANSDDASLDQLKELADFVKENREAIEKLDPLPKGGMDGDVLTLVDGVPAWAEPQGGSGGGWTEDEVLAAVIACGLVTPVGDGAGNLYTDGDGAVYVL